MSQQIVLMDSKGKVLKNIGKEASLAEISALQELAEANEGAVITSQAEAGTEDRYKPAGIAVKLYTEKGGKWNESDGKDIVKDVKIIVEVIKPSDYTAGIEYEFALFNRDLHATTNVKNDTAKVVEDDEIVKRSPDQFYYEIKSDLQITVDAFKKNYLVQVRRKKDDGEFSEWGTQLHTEFMIGGAGSIFGKSAEVSYSSREASMGLKEGKSFKIMYQGIRETKIGENLPKRIFTNKPESSLMGLSVEVSKLRYSTRTKNFNLALSVKANDIDISTEEKKKEVYKTIYELEEVPATLSADDITMLENLKEKGIQLFDGIYIRELNFALDITDEDPSKVN